MIVSMARTNTMRPVRRLLLFLLFVPLLFLVSYRSHWSTLKESRLRQPRMYTVHINGRWQEIRKLYKLPQLLTDVAFPLSRAPPILFRPKASPLRAARFDLRRKRALEQSRPQPLHINDTDTHAKPHLNRTMEDIAADFRARALAEKDIADQKFNLRAAPRSAVVSTNEYGQTRRTISGGGGMERRRRRPLSWGPRIPKISLQDTPKTSD